MSTSTLGLGSRLLAMLSASQDQSTLVARIRSGDAAALGRAYDEHHHALRRFAARLVGDASAADDLVQEVFIALPRVLQGFEGRATLRTFLFGIAARRARHHVRAAARRRDAIARLGSEPAARAHPPPEADLARQRLAEALTRALDRIPLDQRIAFILADVEEHAGPEIAAMLDVPEATVRTRLFHARRKLRALLEAEDLP